jgi:hypothetical protein
MACASSITIASLAKAHKSPTIWTIMNLSHLTPTQLRKAADLTEKIEALNAELSELFGFSSLALVPAPTKTPGKRGPKKGGISAEGRARIAEAQKARWAKANGTMVNAIKTAKPAKRKMSAAGRAAIQASQKARWAKVRAAKA